MFPRLQRVLAEAQQNSLAAHFGNRQPSGTAAAQRCLPTIVLVGRVGEVAFGLDAGESEQRADLAQFFQQDRFLEPLAAFAYY